MTLIFDLFMPK